MARSERFELPTLGIEIRCSIQLSYERPDPGEGPQTDCLGRTLVGRRTDDVRIGSN